MCDTLQKFSTPDTSENQYLSGILRNFFSFYQYNRKENISIEIEKETQTSNIDGSRSSGFRVSPLKTYHVLKALYNKGLHPEEGEMWCEKN